MASHLPEGTDSIIGESAAKDDAAHLGTFGAADAPYEKESAGPTLTSGIAAEEQDDADAGATGIVGGLSAESTGAAPIVVGDTAVQGGEDIGIDAPDADSANNDSPGTGGFGNTASSFDAGATGDDATGASAGAAAGAAAGSTFEQAKAKFTDGASGLKGQATDKAREYALMGKDRATETLNNVSQMLEDVASKVEETVGGQYGGYARQAADQVKAFATTVDEKDVDELIAQGLDLVRKSPGIAIGATAAIGFALARIVKAGLEPAAGGEQA